MQLATGDESKDHLCGRIAELRRVVKHLLERPDEVEREAAALMEQNTEEVEIAEELRNAQEAIAELYRRNRAAFEQSAVFACMLLRATNETQRASSAVLGERNGAHKVTEEVVRSIRRRHPDESIRALAREYGLSPCTVRDIVRRRTWKHVA